MTYEEASVGFSQQWKKGKRRGKFRVSHTYEERSVECHTASPPPPPGASDRSPGSMLCCLVLCGAMWGYGGAMWRHVMLLRYYCDIRAVLQWWRKDRSKLLPGVCVLFMISHRHSIMAGNDREH
jgi:hypothetical protein